MPCTCTVACVGSIGHSSRADARADRRQHAAPVRVGPEDRRLDEGRPGHGPRELARHARLGRAGDAHLDELRRAVAVLGDLTRELDAERLERLDERVELGRALLDGRVRREAVGQREDGVVGAHVAVDRDHLEARLHRARAAPLCSVRALTAQVGRDEREHRRQLGGDHPAPLAKAANVASTSPTCIVRLASLTRVSVVHTASAAELDRRPARGGEPRRRGGELRHRQAHADDPGGRAEHGLGADAERARHRGAHRARVAHARPARRARSRCRCWRRSRASPRPAGARRRRTTGAARTALTVKQPAAAHGTSLKTRARSLRAALIPQLIPAYANPRGVFTPDPRYGETRCNPSRPVVSSQPFIRFRFCTA